MRYSFSAAALLLIAAALPVQAQSDTLLPMIRWSAHPYTHDTTVRDGLLISEWIVKQEYPHLLYLFFDRGSADLAERYTWLRSQRKLERFTDTTIPGGTMEKYRHLLNVTGYRLRKYPSARLTITGCSSDEPSAGENLDLAQRRAELVREYLVSMHGIDPSRLTVEARLLPSHTSNSDDPQGREENRRVELSSMDPLIGDIIVERGYNVFYNPEDVVLRVGNGALDTDVAVRHVEIRRSDTLWCTIPLEPYGDTVLIYNWSWQGDADDRPLDTASFLLYTKVRLRDGSKTGSSPAHIPITIQQVTLYRTPRKPIADISEYNLLLFPFDDATATPFHRTVIERDVKPSIGRESIVTLTGHTDEIGEERHNLRLSERRAAALIKLIRSGPVYPASLDAVGVGEDDRLYTNELPEGRMLNRTVNIRVVSPIEE